jgi:integrase
MGDVVFHALRRAHAAQLIDAGVDVVTISKRLGHASPNISQNLRAPVSEAGRQSGRRDQRSLGEPRKGVVQRSNW